MSGIETISAGWIICNSWAGIAATFALAIAQGGPVTLIYGPIIMCVLVGACAVTLAELASVYPTVCVSDLGSVTVLMRSRLEVNTIGFPFLLPRSGARDL